MRVTQIFISCSKAGCLLFLIIALFAAGCASISDRYETADRIAAEDGFTKIFVKTDNFTLTAYTRFARPLDDLTVYIEGDGSAWLSRTRLSDDPTPRRPLVLELAAMDPAPNIAYLARPGQYTAAAKPDCDPDYWSDRRFSQEVVAAVNQAIDRLLRQARSDRVNLIGYSGGAAIAVLIAARRNDVATLRTVAGNLDTEAVNRHHGVSTLSGSLNPIDAAEKLKNLPQHHFAGAKDTVVPPFIIESFLKRAGDQAGRRFTIVDGVSHTQGWSEIWKSLLTVPF